MMVSEGEWPPAQSVTLCSLCNFSFFPNLVSRKGFIYFCFDCICILCWKISLNLRHKMLEAATVGNLISY